MWELDCEESGALKNWCFWTVVLENTLESPLGCKEIQPVHPKDQSWVFIERTDAEAEILILWPPHVKSWLIGKDPDAGKGWGQKEKRVTEDEMTGWHRQLSGCETEQTPGSLVCCRLQRLRHYLVTGQQQGFFAQFPALLRCAFSFQDQHHTDLIKEA